MGKQATCIYTGDSVFSGKVTAIYGSKYDTTLIDTFLRPGDTVRLIKMKANGEIETIDTLYDFQGGIIIDNNRDTVLQKGDTVKIFHKWLENINHSYEKQAQIYEELLYNNLIVNRR